MRPLIFTPLILTLFSFVFAPSVSAGIIFEIETQENSYPTRKIMRTRVSAEGGSLKVVSYESGNNGQQLTTEELIYRGQSGEIIVVNHQQKSTMTMDRQFVAQLSAQLDRTLGAAGQGAQLGQQRRQQRPNIQVRFTNHEAQVYGYRCVLVTTTRDGRKVRDTWVTEWRNINGGPELTQTFDNMSDFFLDLTAAMPVGAEDSLNETVFATVKQLRGFPVATREYRADGSVKSESALRSAQQLQLNPNVFLAPQGYQPEQQFGGNNTSIGRRQSTGQFDRRQW